MSDRIGLLGVPYDASSSFLRGCADGPSAIRTVLYSGASNWFSESGIDLEKHPGWEDAGELHVDPEILTVETIHGGALEALSRYRSLLSLGGDHSITYPLVKAAVQKHGRMTILHFDAHPDLYDVFEEDRYSHACPFARIMEEGLANRLIQCGIRAATPHQRDQAKRFGVEMHEMATSGLDIPMDFDGPLYISLDLDFFDPAYAPGVSHHEPGGPSPRELLGLLSSIRGTVIGADIVELNPTRDRSGVTAAVGAKFVREFLARML